MVYLLDIWSKIDIAFCCWFIISSLCTYFVEILLHRWCWYNFFSAYCSDVFCFSFWWVYLLRSMILFSAWLEPTSLFDVYCCFTACFVVYFFSKFLNIIIWISDGKLLSAEMLILYHHYILPLLVFSSSPCNKSMFSALCARWYVKLTFMGQSRILNWLELLMKILGITRYRKFCFRLVW